MKIDGSCACGAIRIEGEADPERTQMCHCTDCQSGTGTAFRVSIPVPGTAFKMTGTPTFVIDGKVYGGELSIDQLKAILDPLIKK